MDCETELHAAGGRLTIDLAAVQANYLSHARLVAPARAAAVVKADAYGLGARRIGPSLAAVGCREFFVAHLSEALSLRSALPPAATIYVLNGLQPGSEAACADAGVIPVINSLAQARRWAGLARDRGRPHPAVLQVDSGMSRLGLPQDEVAQLTADPDYFRLAPMVLLISHLACSDDPDAPSNPDQARRFRALASRLPPAPMSLANSGGALLDPAYHLDLVRLGVCLYGAAVHPDAAIRPVVRLSARVIQVRDQAAGVGVGYGLSFHRETPGRIATVAVGYADGWPRSLSHRGAAYHRGVRLPIAGRVSMDSMTLDVSALPQGALALGDEVELLGPDQTLEDVARDAGTIPYEILTGLGRRYHRTHLEAPPAGADRIASLKP